MFSEMTRPSPIPYVFIYLVLLRVPKSLKSLNLSLALIPIPESITEMTNLSLFGSGLNIESMSCSFLNLDASVSCVSSADDCFESLCDEKDS